MSFKPIVLRERADRDVAAAVAYYFGEAGEAIALSFIDALQNAYTATSKRPAAGSPRYGQDLDLPGLRTHALKRFPYFVFYMERADHIDVWRVLHTSRDIQACLQTVKSPLPPN